MAKEVLAHLVQRADDAPPDPFVACSHRLPTRRHGVLDMRLNELRRSGHAPSLAAALIHFDVSFMCWVLLGALGASSPRTSRSRRSRRASSSRCRCCRRRVMRLVLGLLGDRLGPSASARSAWRSSRCRCCGAGSPPARCRRCSASGCCSASPARRSPSRCRSRAAGTRRDCRGSRWGSPAPATRGTVIATLAAPRIAEHTGWHAVMGMALVPVALAFGAFALLAKEPPRAAQPLSARGMARDAARARRASHGRPLRDHVRRLRRARELPADPAARPVRR